MSRFSRLRRFGALPFALGLAACTGVVVPGQHTTPIPGNYLVRQVNGERTPGVTFTLRSNGTFSGRGPCNSYDGASGDPLPGFRVARFGATKRGCDKDRMALETRFFTTLTRVTSITQGAAGLSLSGSEGRIELLRVK